jgi:hypothetical protein
MTHPPSRLCLSDLRRAVPCKYWALAILAALPRHVASYPLPVRQASALPSASSRFAVTRDTLAVRLTLPLAGRVEDFHLQVSAPCRAHQRESRPSWRLLRLDSAQERSPGPCCPIVRTLYTPGAAFGCSRPTPDLQQTIADDRLRGMSHRAGRLLSRHCLTEMDESRTHAVPQRWCLA